VLIMFYVVFTGSKSRLSMSFCSPFRVAREQEGRFDYPDRPRRICGRHDGPKVKSASVIGTVPCPRRRPSQFRPLHVVEAVIIRLPYLQHSPNHLQTRRNPRHRAVPRAVPLRDQCR